MLKDRLIIKSDVIHVLSEGTGIADNTVKWLLIKSIVWGNRYDY